MRKLITLLTLAIVGIAGFMFLSSPATATGGDEPCVPTPGTPASYTDWTNEGQPIRTEENTPPGVDTDLVRYLPAGTIDEQVQSGTETVVITPGQHYSLKGNSGITGTTVPVPPTPTNDGYWQPNTAQEPPGHYGHHYQVDGSSYVTGEEGLHYASHGSSGNRDWFFYRAPVTEERPVFTTDTDYLWQKQVRTLVPGTDPIECPDEPTDPTCETAPSPELCEKPEGEYNLDHDFKCEDGIVTHTYHFYGTKAVWDDVALEWVLEPYDYTTSAEVESPWCTVDGPNEPNEPTEPNEGPSVSPNVEVTPNAPQATAPKQAPVVPTSVDAGLSPVAPKNGSPVLPVGLMLAGLAFITLAAKRIRA